MTALRFAGVALLLAAVLAAMPATAAPAGHTRSCGAGVLHPVGTPRAAYAAVVRTGAEVFRRPGQGRLAWFPRLNANGYPTTFAIVGAIVNRACGASWYRVKLPMRPNGAVGYVRPADVLVQKVTTRIVVDLSARTLRLFRRGRLVLTTTVGVGSPATPTPTGRYFVDQRIVTTDPGGPFGPAVLGVSAFSEVLTGWAQGGPIAIHGTDAPWSVGMAASAGCIRVPNATLRRIFRVTPAGSPVIIRA